MIEISSQLMSGRAEREHIYRRSADVMENLHISSNKKYLMKGDKPFFWLGDTAWMLFTNISYEEAYTYLKNRADKGFNVIQAVLINNAQNKLV